MKKQESLSLEKGETGQEFDDDGQTRRTGTWMSASAHIITAVVGSGVLSLTWCLAQLGWALGTFLLVVCAVISWYTCILLTNCYRSPHPVTGARNYNYMQAVKTNLGGGHHKTSIGMPPREDMSSKDKLWNIFCAIGDIAFAYGFTSILFEIQDTLKSSPPEHKVMKTATTVGISASTSFYMLCGLLGYAAFGNNAPGNYLTGFGFYDPFWLVDIANLCIVIHLLGAYQVVVQPFFAFVENWSRRKWPESRFVHKEYAVGYYRINLFRLIRRSTYVILATLVAMMFPFFNAFLALIGSTTFWPLTVYFPIEMYIVQAKIRKYSFQWIWLRALSLVCLLVSSLAASGSIRGLLVSVQASKLFQSVS
ncbi:hypothetical protein L1987_48970 [Smallanthus sonchifolius]|uniref:Uncharacterized protein n=1 Tax=Smallanthus sonchifolius TaxID=185202 RepID=A0ACB9FUB0_9ASTR|nr:hypothetical protein L1987_48970 [Smallanthus sonchifolius]